MIKFPKVETIKETNSTFLIPSIRIVSEKDIWDKEWAYFSIDFSWFNQSVSFVFKEEERYL
jgi:hypothetical protein